MDLKELLNLESKYIILKNVDGSSIGVLHPTDIRFLPRFNGISELSFTIHKNTCPYYKDITSYKRVEIDGLMKFILEKPQIVNDGANEYKIVYARSFEIDINRKNIPLLQGTYKFYSVNSEEETIMSIIMSYLPNWSIENIDSKLWNIYRTFDLANKPVYDFAMNECSQSYECVFSFDTINQTIKVIAYENIPKKTDIFLSHNNLVNELQLTEKTEDIYTALQVFGANIDINRVNILGNTIYNFNHFLNQDGFMSEILKNRIIEWQNLIEINQPIYSDLLTQRAIKLSDMITLQVELTDLQGQLKALESVRDALLDSGLDATSANNNVKAKRVEINNKQTEIDNKQTEIDNINTQLQTIQNLVAFNQFFTQNELLQIEPFVIQTSITDDNFVITSLDNELQKQEVAQALYDKYKNLLEDTSKLKYEFAVDLINFIPYEQYRIFVNQLQWGSQVTLQVNDEGDLVYPMLLGLDIDWGDNIDIQYLFSTEVKLSDAMMKYDDFSNEVSNMSNKIAGDSIKWSQYVNSGDKDRVFDLFSHGLNLDLIDIKSATNQSIIYDSSGLYGRKIVDGVIDDKQWKFINNKLLFTDDSWSTAKLGIGLITLPDNTQAYGISTEVLMGNLVASNQLIIKNANNTFTVDADSARLVNATLSIENSINKILLDPTNGFKIQNYVNSAWNDVVYLGTDGNLKVKGDIYGGSININDEFIVDEQGNMIATSGEFTGTITASNFNQGTITGSSINIGNGTFTVDTAGNMYAESGEFSGDISGSNIYGSYFRGSGINSAFIKIGVGNGSNLGDLSLYRGGAFTPMFQIYDDITVIDFIRNGNSFLATTGTTTYAYGEWNFSNATGITARFG